MHKSGIRAALTFFLLNFSCFRGRGQNQANGPLIAHLWQGSIPQNEAKGPLIPRPAITGPFSDLAGPSAKNTSNSLVMHYKFDSYEFSNKI